MKNLKQLYLIGFLLVLTSAVSGQIKSGPIVAVSAGWLEKGQIFGPSYGTQYGMKDGKWNSQINFQVGYQFLFPLKNNFAINTSLLYMSRGVHVAYDNTNENKVDESKRFNAISVNAGINYYIIGKIPLGIGLEPTYYLNTKITENLFSHLDIRVSKGCLIINTYNNERLFATRLDVIGQSPTVEEVIISNTFQFVPQTELNVDKLKVVVDGDADIRCSKSIRVNSTCKIRASGVGQMLVEELICQNIEAQVNDVGVLNLKGEAQTGKYSAIDAGKIKAYEFKLENLECKASGSARIQTHVTEILKARATDAGVIKHKGFPRADNHCTGAGKIKRIK